MKTRGRGPQPGFTLLETIMALLIFSVAVVSLVGAINSMGMASNEARRVRDVQTELETLLLEITRHPPQEIISGQRTYESTVRREGVQYQVKMDFIELTNADNQPLPGIYTVKATARWDDGGHKEQLSADTMVYPPLFYAPR